MPSNSTPKVFGFGVFARLNFGFCNRALMRIGFRRFDAKTWRILRRCRADLCVEFCPGILQFAARFQRHFWRAFIAILRANSAQTFCTVFVALFCAFFDAVLSAFFAHEKMRSFRRVFERKKSVPAGKNGP